jgi:hypothetical protein
MCSACSVSFNLLELNTVYLEKDTHYECPYYVTLSSILLLLVSQVQVFSASCSLIPKVWSGSSLPVPHTSVIWSLLDKYKANYFYSPLSSVLGTRERSVYFKIPIAKFISYWALKLFYWRTDRPNIDVEWLKLLLRIREVPGSILESETGCRVEIFVVFFSHSKQIQG